MTRRGFDPPILVGGGAVEAYTMSAVTTGDFDMVTARQTEFGDELLKLGFVRPKGTGHVAAGWLHPELMLGFEVVASTLLDGAADLHRVVTIDFGEDGQIAVIALEDIIADRVAQYASGSADDMLAQARRLFDLHPDADRSYMERRIRHETNGAYGIADLE